MCLNWAEVETEFNNCTDGDLRLMGGSNSLEGRVEVCINRAWGTICDNGFNAEDATVICNHFEVPYKSKSFKIISSGQILKYLS